jgi:NlpC/P60 family
MHRFGAVRALVLCLLVATSAAAEPLGARIARRAAQFVGVASVRAISPAHGDDCTGFVDLIYASEGVSLAASVSEMHRRAAAANALHWSRPGRGDLVFFENTYDRNRNGALDDGPTHVGIVDSVRKDGVVTFVHRVRKGIVRSALDPSQPGLHRDRRGRVHNDFLRRKSLHAAAALTGQLWLAYASARTLGRSLPVARAPELLTRRSRGVPMPRAPRP